MQYVVKIKVNKNNKAHLVSRADESQLDLYLKECYRATKPTVSYKVFKRNSIEFLFSMDEYHNRQELRFPDSDVSLVMERVDL